MAELVYACKYGNIDKVKELLKGNINPNIHDKNGSTALVMASLYGYTEIVKLLLNYEKTIVNPNIQDKNGITALIEASRYNHIEIVKLLLNYEKVIVDQNIRRKQDGSTALTEASRYGYTEMVKLLLNYKKIIVDPNLEKELIHKSLISAHYNGYIGTVKVLVNYMSYRENIVVFIPSYNILLYVLIARRYKCIYTSNIPNEIILLIKEYGEVICGKESFK